MQGKEKGCVHGPFMNEHVDECQGTSKLLCTKKFPLQLGPEGRLIDDARSSWVNAVSS